jgi:hypothetical protein
MGATSAIEYQIRGHGSGVVVLKAVEHDVTAKQDDRQQAIYTIGTLPGTVVAHSVESLACPTAAQLLVAVLASSTSTPVAHALASE